MNNMNVTVTYSGSKGSEFYNLTMKPVGISQQMKNNYHKLLDIIDKITAVNNWKQKT